MNRMCRACMCVCLPLPLHFFFMFTLLSFLFSFSRSFSIFFFDDYVILVSFASMKTISMLEKKKNPWSPRPPIGESTSNDLSSKETSQCLTLHLPFRFVSLTSERPLYTRSASQHDEEISHQDEDQSSINRGIEDVFYFLQR